MRKVLVEIFLGGCHKGEKLLILGCAEGQGCLQPAFILKECSVSVHKSSENM